MKRNWILTGLGAALGAVAGWLYWHYFGCTSGCAITSSPVNSSLYGALMGGLVLNMFAPLRGRIPETTNTAQSTPTTTP